MPCMAECGGYMYLSEEMEDMEGRVWPMVGAVPGNVFRPVNWEDSAISVWRLCRKVCWAAAAAHCAVTNSTILTVRTADLRSMRKSRTGSGVGIVSMGQAR